MLLGATASLAGCGVPDRPHGAGRARIVSDVPVKIGAPYQAGGRTWVPADDPSYDAVGYASWYGGAHRGRATANGERFDPAGISAAHTTLPLPSYVEVTALDTGRTIVARINDRGPFVGGRVIDLSQGAARLLGVEKAGLARVRVRRVSPSEGDRAALRAGRPAAGRPTASRQMLASLDARFGKAIAGVAPRPVRAIGHAGAPDVRPMRLPAGAASIPPPVAGASMPSSPAMIAGGALYVQLAAFDDADRADALASSLGTLGAGAAVAVGPLWRVRIGPYADEAAARSALARARSAGYQDARVVSDSAP